MVLCPVNTHALPMQSLALVGLFCWLGFDFLFLHHLTGSPIVMFNGSSIWSDVTTISHEWLQQFIHQPLLMTWLDSGGQRSRSHQAQVCSDVAPTWKVGHQSLSSVSVLFFSFVTHGVLSWLSVSVWAHGTFHLVLLLGLGSLSGLSFTCSSICRNTY